jgi:hypothetical protein
VGRQALWQEVSTLVTNPAPDQEPAMQGERPVAMTPCPIAVALFAAFVVGGILAKPVLLWLVAVIGLAIRGAVFVFVDRYPRLPPEPVVPHPGDLRGGGRVCSCRNLEAISRPAGSGCSGGEGLGILRRMTDR